MTRHHTAPLLAALLLAGCFDKLPDPLACTSSADCLTGERCEGSVCALAIVSDEDMDAADMNTPDDMRDAPDAAPDLPPDVDTPADLDTSADVDTPADVDMPVDMPARATIVVIEAHSSTDAETLAPGIPLCIFSANFVSLDAAGASITRRVTDAQGQVTLDIDELGLIPATNYRIWTGATEQGEGDTTGYQPYEQGEQYTFPSKGKMKTIKINVVPCDNSKSGEECIIDAACTVP
jgi:hypothetical protein